MALSKPPTAAGRLAYPGFDSWSSRLADKKFSADRILEEDCGETAGHRDLRGHGFRKDDHHGADYFRPVTGKCSGAAAGPLLQGLSASPSGTTRQAKF